MVDLRLFSIGPLGVVFPYSFANKTLIRITGKAQQRLADKPSKQVFQRLDLDVLLDVQFFAKSIRLGASLYASRVSTLLFYLYTTPP